MFTSIPKPIRDKLGDQGAESLAKMLTEFENYLGESIINQSDYRFEKALTQSSSQLRQEMAAMRAELREDMAAMKADLRVEMEKNKSSTIRWMFIFWVGQIGVLTSILFAFFR